MKKFSVKFVREFEAEIEAEDTQTAERIARSITGQFPEGTCRLLSIIAADHVDVPCAACQEDGPIKPGGPHAPHDGRPNGGGSPGTPTLPRIEQLEDQVAAA